jgi:hypothetical protein
MSETLAKIVTDAEVTTAIRPERFNLNDRQVHETLSRISKTKNGQRSIKIKLQYLYSKIRLLEQYQEPEQS